MSSVKVNYYGRTGNHILMYLMAQYIAEKHNLSFDVRFYDYEGMKHCFDITVYSGTNKYDNEIEITDDNVIDFLKCNALNSNVALKGFFQSPEILGNSHIKESYKKYIRPKQIDTASDLFVHVRLGDILNRHSLPYEYYRDSIRKVNFNSGIIASDSPQHEIVQKLKSEFGLNILLASPTDTIYYGSQCKNLVLSAGTFSFLSGFYSTNSNVFYIDNPTMLEYFGIPSWGPDIFSIFKGQNNFYSYRI
jgi:hypothetical protein